VRRSARSSLIELALVNLKLGTIAFGGPAAHIAMFEDEVVRRRGWLTREQFLDYLGAANLIPGPSSTEMAIFVGQARAGRAGLVVAGACFILPAALLVGALAWAYTRIGTLPVTEGLLYGVKPVVIAVVLQALWRLGKSALKGPSLVVVGLAAAAANALGGNELAVLAGAGFVSVLLASLSAHRRRLGDPPSGEPTLRALGLPVIPLGVAATTAGGAGLGALFLVFLKIGATVFGSGYVLLSFLHADMVMRHHWLTESQLLDAVAVGQVTPGPVFTTATFIGYLVGGVPGAMVATAGIFLPGFLLVAVSGPLVTRLRRSTVAGAALDGVNVGALALMAVVTGRLGRAALVDVWTVLLTVVSVALLLRYRVNAAWLVLGGAVAGVFGIGRL